MATRSAAVVVILASFAVPAAADPPDALFLEDRAERVDAPGGALLPRGPLPAPSSTDPLRARLVWLDPTRTAVAIASVAREETSSVLHKMGVSVEWRLGEAGEIARSGEVRVILADRAAARATGEPILGSTPPRFEGEPYFWVHVPNVRAAMGLRADGPLSALEPPSVRALGVALGRVVAHELVHVLAPSAPHGRGLMSEKLTRFQLTSLRLSVDPEVGIAVRASLRGELPPPPEGTGVLAATTTGRTRP